MKDVDFGRTAADYGRHRAGFPVKLFLRLERLGVDVRGRRCLDLGTGTGAFGRELARRGGRVVGLDRSRPLLVEARRLDAAAGVHVDHVEARAERTGLAGGSCELVSAAQCWHWFDGERAIDEVLRLLAPRGAFVLASHDWLPMPGNLVEATEALIATHNPAWTLGGGDGLHLEQVRLVSRAGLADVESFSFDTLVPYTHEGWRGRVRASAGVGASLPPEAVDAFDAAHAKLLEARFPGEPLGVHHRVFAVVARRD